MSVDVMIRPATAADAEACAAIYAPYVLDTSISFEEVPPDPERMRARMAECQRNHEWLIAEHESEVIGYAYGHAFAERAAYRWSCETSIYVALDRRGMGVGRLLYGELLPRLAASGYRRAFAGVTLPNEPSLALHRAFGYEDAGCYRRVGWKQGRWHDVAWLQRDLVADEVDPPRDPRPMSARYAG